MMNESLRDSIAKPLRAEIERLRRAIKIERGKTEKADADNERLRGIIEEQRLTIEALNAVIGGPGSLTTDNLRRAADQPEPQTEGREP